jgi:hypothetical protein
MEPTFRHAREHLGMETQHQWSDKAIARTTPALLGLFSSSRYYAKSAGFEAPPIIDINQLEVGWFWYGTFRGFCFEIVLTIDKMVKKYFTCEAP